MLYEVITKNVERYVSVGKLENSPNVNPQRKNIAHASGKRRIATESENSSSGTTAAAAIRPSAALSLPATT